MRLITFEIVVILVRVVHFCCCSCCCCCLLLIRALEKELNLLMSLRQSLDDVAVRSVTANVVVSQQQKKLKSLHTRRTKQR